MRRFIAVIFVITFSFMLAACADSAAEAPALSQEETAAAAEIEEAEEQPKETKDYVLNINSYKIHLPYCHSVDIMKEYNKKYVNANIDDLIESGYSRCGNCKP